MERIFHTQANWFETRVAPKIRRRTIFAMAICASCLAAWAYFKSWVPLAIGVLVVADRVFELAHIPSTKKTIGALSVVVSGNGLSFRGFGIKGNVLYPWGSLMYKTKKMNGGVPELITIEDKNRRGSKIELTGYEEMGELIALIEGNAGKS